MANCPTEDTTGNKFLRQRTIFGWELVHRGGNTEEATVADVHFPMFKLPMILKVRRWLDGGVDIVGVVLLSGITLAGDAADVDRLERTFRLFIHHDGAWKREVRVQAGESFGIPAANAIGAVVTIVQADHVLGPEPDEPGGVEVVGDLDLGWASAISSRASHDRCVSLASIPAWRKPLDR
jgi:hypothetical protein